MISDDALFPIKDITGWEPANPEQVGSREKEWLKDLNGRRWLLKFPREDRPEIGELWSEKIACELAELLSLPHVHYDFARSNDRIGVICESFTDAFSDLQLGNVLLGIPSHEPTAKRRVAARQQHTLNRVIAVLQSGSLLLPQNHSSPGKEVERGIDVFVGYLLLDAWISNTDRHEQNWGTVMSHRFHLDLSTAWLSGWRIESRLAPTFDHASCLGRELRDERRKELLSNPELFLSYLRRAESKLYNEDGTRIHTVDAFFLAAKRYPLAARYWLEQLEKISKEQIEQLFQRIPKELMSKESADLAMAVLTSNKGTILGRRT